MGEYIGFSMIEKGIKHTGIQVRTKDELEVKAGGSTALTAKSSHVITDYAICTPSTIASGVSVEVPTSYNAVMSGPITINGSLTINGRLTIV